MSGPDEGNGPDARHPPPDRHVGPPPPRPWTSPSAWNIPDIAPDSAGEPGRPLAALVSFHYLRAAVRRRLVRCALAGLLGLVLASAFLILEPPLPTATTTLMLTHDARLEASAAISTDMSLLTTQTVANRTAAALGPQVTPQEIMGAVTPVETGSSEILQLTLTAPTAEEAARRLAVFSREYLSFRADQLGAQSDVLIQDHLERIKELQGKVDQATARLQQLQGQAKGAADQVGNLIAERSTYEGHISELQQQAQETQLQRDAVRKASQVIDPPRLQPAGRLRRTALALLSGLIGGLALGFTSVVLQAILSDRLWLRVEVASALDVPVPVSVGPLTPPSRLGRLLAPLPWLRRRRARREADAQRVGDIVVRAIPVGASRPSIGVLCLGNAEEVRWGVFAAEASQRRRGRSALV